MCTSRYAVPVICCSSSSSPRPSVPHESHHNFKFPTSFPVLPFKLISISQPLLRKMHDMMLTDVPATIKRSAVKLLDAFVDLTFEFVDQPLLPSQSNFAPVEELGKAYVREIEGWIPDDFPEGIYIRNGPNPVFGGYKSAISVFGKSSHVWVEGEGMLHALYFSKARDGSWNVCYKNRYVESETFKLEKKRNKLAFLPAAEGDSPAVLSAHLLNMLRFGMVDKLVSNTNVLEFCGKFYVTAENHVPQEIDIVTLETIGKWDVDGTWTRPFTSHSKKVPCTGELVMFGIYPKIPYYELGVISADGKKLIHKVDINLSRCPVSHDIGITERYNVIMDFPLTIDINRLIRGGPLVRFEKEGIARIGVMPRCGDADSMKWFEVENCAVFHLFNCFEDGDEVVVIACRARGSIIPGPELGANKFEWFSRGFKHIKSVEETHKDPQDGLFFSRAYEWRLNIQSGEVKGRNLTGIDFSMEFPIINEKFTGTRNKFGYTQLVDSYASSNSGMAKYGGLAKLNFEEKAFEYSPGDKQPEELIKVEYHKFPESTFCSGASFVPNSRGLDEDDGWIITYVHNENTNISQVYIVDAKKFSSEPIAKITLPSRVPYGFHGLFVSTCSHCSEDLLSVIENVERNHC